jgi:hypothetical protein
LSIFKRRRFPIEIILLCVRWYCKYGISYRDLAEMMQERGVTVDPSTIFRWIQRYAPEIEKRIRPIAESSPVSRFPGRQSLITRSSTPDRDASRTCIVTSFAHGSLPPGSDSFRALSRHCCSNLKKA